MRSRTRRSSVVQGIVPAVLLILSAAVASAQAPAPPRTGRHPARGNR